MQGRHKNGQHEKNGRIHRPLAGIRPIGPENRPPVTAPRQKAKRAPLNLGFFRKILIIFSAIMILGLFAASTPPEGTGDSGSYQGARWFLIVLFAGIIAYSLYSAWKKRRSAATPPAPAPASDAPLAQNTQEIKARSTVYTVVKCPYCGAKAKVLKGAGGLCEYCGMKVTEKE